MCQVGRGDFKTWSSEGLCTKAHEYCDTANTIEMDDYALGFVKYLGVADKVVWLDDHANYLQGTLF